MTAEQQNKLAGKIMKAKMRGQHEKAARLQERLEESQNVVVITPMDERGRMLRSLQSGKAAAIERDDLRSGSRRGKRRRDGTEKGEPPVSLERLIEMERLKEEDSMDDVCVVQRSCVGRTVVRCRVAKGGGRGCGRWLPPMVV